MVKVVFQYHEIIESDYTAVDAFIESAKRRVAHFRNYSHDALDRPIYGNQRESFQFPSIAAARRFLKSAGVYREVSD